MHKLLLSMAVFAALATGSGCLSSRTIGGVMQSGRQERHPGADAGPLLRRLPLSYKMAHQFWKCSEAPAR